MEKELPLTKATPTQETLLGEWDEAEHPGFAMEKKQFALVLLGSAVLTVLSVILGIWQHDINYYFATAVFVLLIVTLLTQAKRTQPRLHIMVTTTRVIVGNRQYQIPDLSGFWLSHDAISTVINLETQKPGLAPISFFYGGLNEQEARSVMNQVLPELEARIATTADQISRYFRF